jgi:hypothetical protein
MTLLSHLFSILAYVGSTIERLAWFSGDRLFIGFDALSAKERLRG